jgi:hypothetical protein
MFNARPAGSESVDQDGRSLSIPRRGRGEGAAGASGVSIGAGLLTRVVQLVLSVVVAIIVAGILLVVLKANPGNSIVSEVHS